MKLNHHLTLFAAVASLCALCACSGEKPYTITGNIDLPEQIPYGDTLIDVPEFEGTWVYLMDFENQLLDSAQITGNTFKFTGKIKKKDAYFVHFASLFGSSLLVIEPGDIEVFINPDITISGTPSNDAMSDIDAALENLNADTYEYLAHLTDSMRAEGKDLPEDEQMKIADEFSTAMNNILDSAYHANRGNQAGAYAVVMRNMYVESADAFEEAMKAYPEEIRNNDLVQTNLRMMRQYEMFQQEEQHTIDPSLFGIEEGDAIESESK